MICRRCIFTTVWCTAVEELSSQRSDAVWSCSDRCCRSTVRADGPKGKLIMAFNTTNVPKETNLHFNEVETGNPTRSALCALIRGAVEKRRKHRCCPVESLHITPGLTWLASRLVETLHTEQLEQTDYIPSCVLHIIDQITDFSGAFYFLKKFFLP